MVIHVHHKSVHSEGSGEFTHLARIQKVLSEGSGFDNFFFLDDEGREDPNTVNPLYNDTVCSKLSLTLK